ncbi:MAG TPA: hypothetical protein VGP51_08930 [Nocardioidaceae bacterium]|jgi:hypothetical protein|nr:hypothetical protein [Actinomycetota bacterium]MDQ3423895.1 hypothetical protein [Actinomycetota bacterium]HEV8056597.1 hypothetical protein [Nocardioidaceae bacterium]
MSEYFTEDLALLRTRDASATTTTRHVPPRPPHEHRRHVASALRRLADRIDG